MSKALLICVCTVMLGVSCYAGEIPQGSHAKQSSPDAAGTRVAGEKVLNDGMGGRAQNSGLRSEIKPDGLMKDVIIGISGQRWNDMLVLIPAFEEQDTRRAFIECLKKAEGQYYTAQLLKPPVSDDKDIYIVNKRTHKIGPTPVTLSVIPPLSIYDSEAMQLVNFVYTILEKNYITIHSEKAMKADVFTTNSETKVVSVESLNSKGIDRSKLTELANYLVYMAHDINYGVFVAQSSEYVLSQLKEKRDPSFIIKELEKMPARKWRR